MTEISKKDLKNATDCLIQSHFTKEQSKELIRHLTESFDDFISRKIDDIIQGFNPIKICHQFLPQLSENVGIPKYQYYMEIDISNPVISKAVAYHSDGSTKIMTPTDARNRNLTYSGPLTVNVNILTRTYNQEKSDYIIEKKTINNVLLGKIPIMVGSRYALCKNDISSNDECRYDPGGYFIINGNEKVVVSQDRIAENKTYVFINNKESAYSYVAEIRSVQENKFSVPKTTTLKLSNKPNQYGRYIRVNVHHIKHDIPLFILFRALGVESDKDILKYIVYDVNDPDNDELLSQLEGSIEEANNVMYSREALDYLLKYLNITGYTKECLSSRVKRMDILRNVLHDECLPHVGKEFNKKALYLGFMVNKLIKCFLGKQPFDDRDSYINKRVDTPGILMANLFRQYYGKVIKDMKNMIQKDANNGSWKTNGKFINVINKVNVSKMIKMMTIESGLKYSLATGNWGIKSNKTKQGVAQVVNRFSFNGFISHLRRINTPIDKTAKIICPRKLHGTQMGIICPAETPEGVSVGLVKYMSIMCNVTISSNSMNLRECLKNMDVVYFDGSNIDIFAKKATKVIVNGDIIGVHKNPYELYNNVKFMKRKGIINVNTGIVWNIPRGEVSFCTEAGRCTRPLYIVENNKIRMDRNIIRGIVNNKLDFPKLVIGMLNDKFDDRDNSIIEYLDVEEVNCSMLAMSYEDLEKARKNVHFPVSYTHLEIDPSLMMGVMAGSIPFSNHNQAPRNCYQAAMAKQAIGIYASNFRKRYDTLGHILNYGQAPLVQTKPSKIVNTDKLPSGINAIVAIATYTGYNQEDSLVMNESAIHRGLFHSTYYRTYKEQNNKNHSTGEEELFCNPCQKDTIKLKPYNYNKLNNDGFVPENRYVEGGDILIGKCMPQKQNDVTLNKDTSVVLKNNEQGFVDRNCYNDKFFTNINGDGYPFGKVRLRSDRIPVIGDKFSSRMGQKGTNGMLLRQEDMPFTMDGITPDIIINPHAIPSRMTIGQLLECVMGKACTKLGTYGDGTPFTDFSVEEVSQALEDNGLERYGNEIMYNSQTGEQIHTDIFIGPTYYQRLKHMTNDKVHSRAANGPVVMLSHQPSEGRARDGGLRIKYSPVLKSSQPWVFGYPMETLLYVRWYRHLAELYQCLLLVVIGFCERLLLQHIQIAGTPLELSVPNMDRNIYVADTEKSGMVKIR